MFSSPRLSAAARRLALAGLLVLVAPAARADTIIKLDLGDDAAADLIYSGGVLSTVDDGDAGTVGDQNTDVEFLGFLSSFPDIVSAAASYTLSGVTASGTATILSGVLAVQNLTGGTFSIFDENDVLLLSATLGNSILTGLVGPPATGAVFSSTFASLLSGGTLDSYIDPSSISFSISLTDIDGGSGLTVGAGDVLAGFSADATQSIAAEVPEPKAAALLGLGAALLALLATPAPLRSARCTVRGTSAARPR